LGSHDSAPLENAACVWFIMHPPDDRRINKEHEWNDVWYGNTQVLVEDMSQKNLFSIKPKWTARRMNQGCCQQFPEDINLDRLPRFELNCDKLFTFFYRHCSLFQGW